MKRLTILLCALLAASACTNNDTSDGTNNANNTSADTTPDVIAGDATDDATDAQADDNTQADEGDDERGDEQDDEGSDESVVLACPEGISLVSATPIRAQSAGDFLYEATFDAPPNPLVWEEELEQGAVAYEEGEARLTPSQTGLKYRLAPNDSDFITVPTQGSIAVSFTPTAEAFTRVTTIALALSRSNDEFIARIRLDSDGTTLSAIGEATRQESLSLEADQTYTLSVTFQSSEQLRVDVLASDGSTVFTLKSENTLTPYVPSVSVLDSATEASSAPSIALTEIEMSGVITPTPYTLIQAPVLSFNQNAYLSEAELIFLLSSYVAFQDIQAPYMDVFMPTERAGKIPEEGPPVIHAHLVDGEIDNEVVRHTLYTSLDADDALSVFKSFLVLPDDDLVVTHTIDAFIRQTDGSYASGLTQCPVD